jgi:hypothetical protein
LIIDLLITALRIHAHTLLGLVSGVLHFAFERAKARVLFCSASVSAGSW